MVEPGDLVIVSSEEYQPWWVVCHRVRKADAYRIIKGLDVPTSTLNGAPDTCKEFTVLLKGFRRERAILVPSREVTPTKKSETP